MLDRYIQNQISYFAIALLLILLISTKKSNTRRDTSSRIYFWIVWTTLITIVSDITAILTNGIDTPATRLLMTIAIVTYYIFHIIVAGLWMLYVEYAINDSSNRFWRIYMLVIPVTIFVAIFSILSINGDIIFRLADGNIYERGTYFYVVPVVTYGMILLAMLTLIRFRKRVHPDDFLALLIFPIPPIIGGIIQISFQGFSLIWPGVALSVLIVYIHIQSRLTNTDHLTGLKNRREYDHIIEYKYENLNKGYMIGGIMMDINDFKLINDKFYHQVGDEALIHFANILTKSTTRKDFVARIGGDEFIILIETKDEMKLSETIKRIEENLKHFNETEKKPYQLSVSMGATYFDPKIHINLKEFFKILDQKMYEMKENK